MNLKSAVIAFFLFLSSTGSAAESREHLVLFGGGPRPPAALAHLVKLSGQDYSRVLVILWATEEPHETFASLRAELQAHSPATIEAAPLREEMIQRKYFFLQQLMNATAVFFSGGDQNRIMDVLADDELRIALLSRSRQGVVFGGTSAGTAIMSPQMISDVSDTGVIDPSVVSLRPGLGLLDSVILDQHFIRRQRQNRLFAVILNQPTELGVGVDEGAALLVTDRRFARPIGGKTLMVDGLKQPGSLVVQVVEPSPSGEPVFYDLQKRELLKRW